MNRKNAYVALVPAAGTGARFGGDLPKQYLALAGRPMIWHALDTLCATPDISAVHVVLSPEDVLWERYDWSSLGAKLRPVRCGGATRAESVSNGLLAIADQIGADDWVLVHDAARACISTLLVSKLIETIGDDPVGGILALPVADTLKHSDDHGVIDRTVARDRLWQAQTPQMFRHGMLLKALNSTKEVTDEASAMEALGHRPKLVTGNISNLKVTWPEDMQLAELILIHRQQVTRGKLNE